MKFNIKNRPRFDVDLIPEEAEGWFQGFETELRDMLETYGRFKGYSSWQELVKEILGEQPK